jgi:hypothetical protein
MRSTTLVSLVVSLVFVASGALAQKKPKAKKQADGPSAAETWKDPVENEKSDKPAFAPQKEGGDEPKPEPKNDRAPDRGRTRDKIDVFGQIIIGFGRAPQNQPSYAAGDKGTALGFLLGGRFDFTPTFSGGLRVPFTTATVKHNGVNLSTSVMGAPELFGEYRLSLNRLSSVPIFFGVGIPVAQGNPDQTGTDTAGHQKNYVNQLADATSGWRDSELFQPKRLPIVVGAGLHHDRHDWEAHADAKFVLSPALSTKVADPSEDPPNPGTYKINSFAMREVTTLGGSYNFLDKPLIYAGLDLAIVWTPVQTFVFDAEGGNSSRPSAVQAVLEPRVGARFGKISPSIGYIAPLGGRLGDAGDGGVRLRVDALF